VSAPLTPLTSNVRRITAAGPSSDDVLKSAQQAWMLVVV